MAGDQTVEQLQDDGEGGQIDEVVERSSTALDGRSVTSHHVSLCLFNHLSVDRR